MANDKKFIAKNGLKVQNIAFVDTVNASNASIVATMLADGTLSFSGTSGQLFSITDSLTGTIFSVNDISGIPSIEVDDDGTVRIAEFDGNILIGTANNDGVTKLQVSGDVTIDGDFTITGNVVSIQTENLQIGDNLITINSDETGTPTSNSGIEIERGTFPNVTFIWDEVNDRWTVSGEAFEAGSYFINGYGTVVNANGEWTGDPDTVRGYTGSQGPIGYTGSQGPIGYTGSQGIQGIIGYTGSKGDQGVIGYTGSQGIQGVIGYTGSQGVIGYSGSKGDQGVIGYTGSQGSQGIQGYTGSQGDQGLIGFTGSQGIQGVIGYTGSQGIQGDIGYTGSKGDQGIIGYTGSKGDQGIIGFTGSKGDQGIIGYTGSKGDQGIQGYTGSQGDQGVIGYTGSQGDIGYTGSQGIQGAIGYTGSLGDIGFTGSKGDQGIIGYTGSQGSQGIQGIIGYTGSQGDIGFTGSKGDQGSQGALVWSGNTAPSNTEVYPLWYDENDGSFSFYYDDGDSQQWVDIIGVEGPNGPIGYTGSQGITGYTGSKGTTGDFGYTGSQGSQGVIGYTGSQGSQGVIGYTGSQGSQGVIGYTGSQGVIGYTGSQGTAYTLDTTEYGNTDTQVIDFTTADIFYSTLETANIAFTFNTSNAVQTDVCTLIMDNNYNANAWTLNAVEETDIIIGINLEEPSGRSVRFKPDGSKIFLIGSGTDGIYQFNLNVPWDLSSAVGAWNEASVGTEATAPEDIAFSSDGTKVYVSDATTGKVYEYEIYIPWDVTAINYTNNSLDVTAIAAGATPVGLDFSSNGIELYIADQTSNKILQYTLSTAWDITSATHTANLDISSYTTAIETVRINPNGTNIFINNYGFIWDIPLSVAWDITSAGASTGSYIPPQPGAPKYYNRINSFDVSPDGTKLFRVSFYDENIRQYNLSTPKLDFTGINMGNNINILPPHYGHRVAISFLTSDYGNSFSIISSFHEGQNLTGGAMKYHGYTGSQGIQGVIGYTGSQGDIGYTGSTSTVIGYTGSRGPSGPAIAFALVLG